MLYVWQWLLLNQVVPNKFGFKSSCSRSLLIDADESAFRVEDALSSFKLQLQEFQTVGQMRALKIAMIEWFNMFNH